LDLARGATILDVESDALGAIGDAHLALGDLAAAQQVYDQAYDIAASRDSARYIARAHEGHAHVAAANGDLAAAQDHWRRALLTFPGGVADPVAARRHLADPTATCWRCRTQTGQESP
jgi:tetratricopeptide (TPR) repeat protein